jgi:predicted acylesterase/phospholipase RssA
MERIPLQFVFQGGGAKLVPLLGAAHAVHDQAEQLGYDITRVSGASAGAIAAAMLAMGMNPTEFRERLLRLAKENMRQIIRPLGRRSYLQALAGFTLYNSDMYRTFLRDLFTRRRHLSERKIDIRIHASDIRNGSYKLYTGDNNEDWLDDALFSSSAIPFLFHTYRHGGSFIDGGIIDNFPSALLMNDPDKGDVVGFSFQVKDPYQFDNGLKSYVTSIAFTAMDYSVERSLKQLSDENVYYISTDLSTLDFEQALEQLGNDNQYKNYKACVETFLEKLIVRKREKIAAENDFKAKAAKTESETVDRLQKAVAEAQQYVDTLGRLHRACCAADDFAVKKLIQTYRCNALKSKHRTLRDEVRYEDHIILHKDLHGYSVAITSGETHPEGGEIEFRITDLSDNEIPHGGTSVASPRKYITADTHNILLFLSQPLRAAMEMVTKFRMRATKMKFYMS